MQLFYGVPEDIKKWMSLVTQVRWNFSGLKTQEKLNEHRATILKFMDKRQAICVTSLPVLLPSSLAAILQMLSPD